MEAGKERGNKGSLKEEKKGGKKKEKWNEGSRDLKNYSWGHILGFPVLSIKK